MNSNVYSEIKLNTISSTPDVLNSTEKKINFQQIIHYGANGKFIDVKNPFSANSNLSKFIKSEVEGGAKEIDNHLPIFNYINADH